MGSMVDSHRHEACHAHQAGKLTYSSAGKTSNKRTDISPLITFLAATHEITSQRPHMSITVTKPFMPPLHEYNAYVHSIWQRGWVTNNGPLVNDLELRLKAYLGLEHLLLIANGTLSLQIAIKALHLHGQIITTPFSYVATTSSIIWENCEPVMVDICPNSWNIDPAKIEQAITPRTSAILATHVYGNPCAIDDIQAIAAKYGLKVIYDAAHAFGTQYQKKSIYAYGDISTASFHATKLYHTIEGGAVITQNPDLVRKMSLLRNFGHVSAVEFECAGINGKVSEFHAAMGLCNLRYIDSILSTRRKLCERYDNNFRALQFQRPKITHGCTYNYAYYPILLESEALLKYIVEYLALNNVLTRRYFYPSLSSLPYLDKRQSTPICDNIAPRVLCLPLYHTLSMEEVDMISRLIHRAIKYRQK